MDIFRRQKFNEAMFAKNRTLAIRVGAYQSSDIKEASFEYGYIKGDTYKPGGTCAGSGKITFTSIITTFNKLDKIYPEIGLLVDGTYEWVKMGEYFINDIEIDRNRNTTTLDLMDGMFKLNREHVTDLTYPAEIRHVIKEICLKTGIKLANENMGIASMNYRIEQIPKEKKMTFRYVLSLATQMLGMSCFFNREGKLEIKELTDSGITITADSYFMHGLTKSEVQYQIAGITCKKDKEILTVGLRTGRSLELDNLFMSQAVLDNLYHKIKDIRYYPFNLNYQGHLLLDVGQWVTIKTNTGETFKSPVLSQSFTFKGGLRGRISADSKAGNDAQYSYSGTLTKKIEQFNDLEAQIQNQIEEADKGFDQKVEKIKKDFSDQVELVKAKAEEVKRELSDTIDQRFRNFDTSGIDEAKRKATEALAKVGANASLAQEAKRISEQAKSELNNFKASAERSQAKLTEDIETFKNQYGSKLNDVKRTADGLFLQMGQVETFINSDGQRQEALKKYARDESANQISAFRQVISSDYVAKNIYEEDVRGISQRIEAVKTEANKQVATQIASYKQSVDGKFTDISSQMTTYKKSADGQIVNLSNQVSNNKINSDKQISNISSQILANKASADSQIANVANQLSRKVEVTDFQRVKETSQLYERILGTSETGAPDKLSRLVMSSSIFQTEVGKYVTDDNNLIVNSEAMDKHTLVNANRNGVNVSVSDGVFTIKAQGLTSYNFSGFTLPIYVKKIYRGETYTLGFKYRIREKVDTNFVFVVKNHKLNKGLLSADLANPNTQASDEWREFQRTFTVQEDFAFGEDTNYPFYIYIAKNGWIEFKEPILVRGSRTGTYKPSQFDDAYKATENAKQLAENAQAKAVQVAEQANQAQQIAEATRTRVNQLAGSWAVQNLTSAGSIVSQINATNNQILIEAEKIRLKGKTLLDELTAIDGYFKRLFVGEGNFAKLNAEIIGSKTITADMLIMDWAMARLFVSSDIFTDTLAAKEAFINKLRSVVVTATLLEGYKGRIGGFQIGTHDKDPSTYWLTGTNQFAVGMSNGNTKWGQTALWVNWGNDWGTPGDYAWFVKRTGEMYCYNRAYFWNTPKINGDLWVTGEILYNNKASGGGSGYWISSPQYKKIEYSNGYIYFYSSGGTSNWIPTNKEISDRRYKSNIEDSQISGLDVIENLKTYSYRKEYDGKIEDIACGIMAQDVQKYAPEAFFENPDGAYSYRTFELVPYLIKAIQELNQKIEKMEKTA